MKVTLERLPESRVQLDIEVDQERLEQSLDAAYKRLAQKARIPGFRPGKAPRQLIERTYGREGLIREALDRLVPDVYNDAIEQEDVDAIAQPELEILELEPVHFKATVAVRPTVTLGDYRSIRVERQPVEVTDEQVEETVLNLRRRFAERVEVERPAQWGDILKANVHGKIKADTGADASDGEDGAEDEAFVDDENAEFPLREGQTLLVPGLAEAFVGMTKDESKDVELTIPDDFRVERLQGKSAAFTLTVLEVREEQLPPEDEELAKKVGEEFATFDDVRARIREDLRKGLEENEENRVKNDAVEKLIEQATLDFPAVLIEREIDHLIREAMGNDRQQYASYLARVGRSEQEFRETWRESAEQRVRQALVIAQLEDDENIEVTEADISAEIDRMASPLGDEAEKFRELFMNDDTVSTIRRNLLTRRTLDRLAGIVTSDAPTGSDASATAADGSSENAAGSEEPAGQSEEEGA